MSYTDKPLTCVDCGTAFVFTISEQEFHASKGFTNEPRRCLLCRQARRAARSDTVSSHPVERVAAGGPAGTTGPGTSEGSRRASRERPGTADAATPTAAGGSSARVYAAVCSACRGEALLPFEPLGNRPVLCSSCYDKIYAPAGRA